jgi:hypothetical protein
MDDREINEKADQLVTKAEKNEKITAELNNMDFRDRLQVVQRMQEINSEHRKTNSDLPQLEVTTTKDLNNEQHIADIQMKTERSYFNPKRWFGDSFAKNDVYDPPHEELGSGLLGQTADVIHSRTQQLNSVLAELDKQQGRR